MASALNKLVDSLVKQGTQLQVAEKGQKAQAGSVLPHWIFEGAPLSYHSPRSEQALKVIVESISHSKQQVRFVFETDRKVWKAVTFAQVLCGSSPLRQRHREKGAPGPDVAGQDVSVEVTEAEAFLDRAEQKWNTAASIGSGVRERGPALNKVPLAWAKKDVVDVDNAEAVHVDSSPEREVIAAEESRDPYGLGEGLMREEAPHQISKQRQGDRVRKKYSDDRGSAGRKVESRSMERRRGEASRSRSQRRSSKDNAAKRRSTKVSKEHSRERSRKRRRQ